MVKAFIFDLDGTLIDSEVLYLAAVEQVLTEAGCAATEDELLKIVYGHGWGEVLAAMRAHCPALSNDDAILAAAIEVHFNRMRETRDIRIASSVALLKQLSGEYPVSIVSGSYRAAIAEAIEIMEAKDNVTFYIGCEEYSPGKPDPVCYRLAAQRHNIDPAECLVFEDSAAGVRAAKAAGMHCVALARPGRPPQDYAGADLVLTDLEGFTLEHYAANRIIT